mmetsp:Transcript_1792/g.2431  ORF Transcript_1792/g.2431 Transcript_1792/m.2431 type:complete len:321 (+) Transcript_1792:102-1064(+)
MSTESSSDACGGALDQARHLDMPAATSVTKGEVEHLEFWSNNGQLLRNAWKEYEGVLGNTIDDDSSGETGLPPKCIHPALATAVNRTWDSPNLKNEEIVRSLWKEAEGSQGELYTTQLLTEEGIQWIRQELNKVSNSGIPTRRPNGMNRYGIILDDTVDGAATLSTLTIFCNKLVDDYVRPIGRMLFPDSIGHGDDFETYPFTIRYKLGEDVKLNEHRDASVVTININLNLPGEDYGGSSLYFVDSVDPSLRHNVTFSPGMAIVHRGALRHAALPIEAGERCNLVIWLFGEGGHVRIAPYSAKEQLSVTERWSKQKKLLF